MFSVNIISWRCAVSTVLSWQNRCVFSSYLYKPAAINLASTKTTQSMRWTKVGAWTKCLTISNFASPMSPLLRQPTPLASSQENSAHSATRILTCSIFGLINFQVCTLNATSRVILYKAPPTKVQYSVTWRTLSHATTSSKVSKHQTSLATTSRRWSTTKQNKKPYQRILRQLIFKSKSLN